MVSSSLRSQNATPPPMDNLALLQPKTACTRIQTASEMYDQNLTSSDKHRDTYTLAQNEPNTNTPKEVQRLQEELLQKQSWMKQNESWTEL